MATKEEIKSTAPALLDVWRRTQDVWWDALADVSRTQERGVSGAELEKLSAREEAARQERNRACEASHD
ncbi:MAG: hypothetical protein IKZ87_00180 [Actinomycetaceae bacterium]|nr:hypothetical protein [Actinomycetaceae bacterium]